MSEVIEGKKPVLEALKAHVPIKFIYLVKGIKPDGVINEICDLSYKQGVRTNWVNKKEFLHYSTQKANQGVLARVEPFSYCDIDSMCIKADNCAQHNNGNAIVVLLDHITDAGNLGAIARSAEIFGACGMIIPKKRSAHVSASTYKSSAGAIVKIPVAKVSNITFAIERLKNNGFWIIGASEKSTQKIWDVSFLGKIGLILGNEEKGLAQRTQQNCDFLASIPQIGTIESLNVAQATTSFLYEWLRQTNNK